MALQESSKQGDVELRELCLQLAERAHDRSERLAEIYAYLASPRQMQMVAELPQRPQKAMRTEQLAEKLGMLIETVREDLMNLHCKGMVYVLDPVAKEGWWFCADTTATKEVSQWNAAKFFPDPNKLHDLWRDYHENGGYAI